VADIRFTPGFFQQHDMKENEMRIPRGTTPTGCHARTAVLEKALFWLLLPAVALAVWGCAPATYGVVPQSPEVTGGSPPPMQQLYFYPKSGQSTERQSRDHYDCYNWAVNQTGFDPGQSTIPQGQRVAVVPMPPPGHDTATYAIAGAVLGALFGGPHHAAQGAIVGGTAGALAGAASDSARQESARQMNETRNRQYEAQLNAKALDFRRAMSACMEGRGYTVR
jgi:hypothetical protein